MCTFGFATLLRLTHSAAGEMSVCSPSERSVCPQSLFMLRLQKRNFPELFRLQKSASPTITLSHSAVGTWLTRRAAHPVTLKPLFPSQMARQPAPPNTAALRQQCLVWLPVGSGRSPSAHPVWLSHPSPLLGPRPLLLPLLLAPLAPAELGTGCTETHEPTLVMWPVLSPSSGPGVPAGDPCLGCTHAHSSCRAALAALLF